MTNNKNRNEKENEVIYDSSKNRHENVTHQADGDTYKNGQKVREGEHHDKVVVDRDHHVREDHVHHEKKSNPLKWILPLLLLLILVPLLFKFCNDNKAAEDDVKTEEKATTEAPTTETTTTEEAVETTEEATEEKTSDAQVKSFDLASIINFDLVA
ncbi:hypothetical protein [Macrococcoides canis]|uniref:hypothetical protein n=1 Tax=Macrococcoides canis TaxID=1855823 RepID=UPI0020B7C8B1|nr:hypothetical protein [Macrococcus canis]UTH06114.1 hypothetical protein KFV07_07955 [Macrococcus canis]